MSSKREYLVDGKYSFQDLVDLDRLREMFEHFSQATDFTTGLFSLPDSEVLISTGWREICSKFHDAFPASEVHCQKNRLELVSQLHKLRTLHITHCGNGLMDAGMPIIIEGAHIANLSTGQVFFEKPDGKRYKKRGEEYGYDIDAYLEALEKVPVVPEARLKSALTFLAELAVSVAEQGLAAMRLRESSRTIQESEAKFRAIFDQTSMLLGIMSPDGTLLSANETALNSSGLEESDIIGKPFWETAWWTQDLEQQKRLREAIERAASGEYVRFEACHEGPDGKPYYIDFSLKPVKDDAGKVLWLIPEGRDITERKQAQEQILAEKEFTDTALNAQMDTFFLFEPATCKALRWNRAFSDLTGYTDEEISEMPAPASYYGPDALERVAAFMQQVLVDGTGTIGLELICKDGRKIPTEYRVSVIKDDQGEPKYLISIGRDITERKKVEERFRLAAQIASDLIYEWDIVDDTLVWFGDIDGALGCAPGETPRTIEGWVRRIHPDDVAKMADAVERHRESTENIYYEYRVRHEDGTWRYWVDNGTPVLNDEGRPVKWIGTCTDITERKRAEEELRRYEQIVSSSNDMLALLDENFVYLAVNQRYLTAFGKNQSDLVGSSVSEIFGETFFETVIRPHAEKCLQGHQVCYQDWFDFPALGKRYMEITYDPYRGPDNRIAGFVVNGRDATERKQAEEALRESEENYRSLVANIPDVVWTADENSRTTFVSDNVTRVYGYTPEEIRREGERLWLERIHPDDIDRVREVFESLVGEGTSFDIEYRIKRKDGRWIWLHDRAIKTQSDQGVVRVDGVFSDITERKQSEQALMESEKRLREAQQMARLGHWFWDVKSGDVKWSEEVYRIYRLDPGEFTPHIDSIQALSPWPEDHERDQELIRRAIESHEQGSYEQRFLFPDGSTGHCFSSFQGVYDDNGDLTAMKGTVQDITERKLMEEVVRESEERYRMVADKTGQLVYDYDIPTGRIQWLGDITRLTGFSAREFEGTDINAWEQMIHPDDRQAVVVALDEATRNRSQFLVEYRFVCRDGSYIHVEDNGGFLVDDSGAAFRMLGTMKDITERKLMEKGLGEERERAQSYLDIAGVMFVAIDATGTVTLTNRKTCEVLGYTEEEIVGRNWFDTCLPKRLQEPVRETFVQLMRSEIEGVECYENPVLTSSGAERLIAWHNTILRDDGGNILGTLSSGEDITERKRMEEALKESMERLKGFDQHSNEGVYRVDIVAPVSIDLPREEIIEWIGEHAVIGEVNDSLARMYGLEPLDMIGRPAIEFAPDYGTRAALLLENEECRVINEQRTDVDKDGKPLYLLESYHGTIENGHLVAIWGAQSNITDLKHAEMRLQTERVFTDTIIKSMPGLFYIFEEKSARFVRRNANFATITGYSDEELDAMTALDLLADRDLCMIRMQEVFDHGSSSMENHLLTKSGEQIPYFFTGHRLVVEDTTYLVGMGLDMTERVRAEEALQQSEAKFRGLVESSSDWIWEVDAEGAYTYTSPQLEDILGYKPEEVIGKTPFDLMPPEEAERVAEVFKGLIKRGDSIVALENVNLHKDGHHVVLETNGIPLFNATGNVIGYRGVDRDITDRKRAVEEKLTLERQVQHTQKLESLGVLAGGIAHDFNNILMAILGNAELALDELSPHAPARQNLNEIEKASKRAAELATQMLAYSGKGRFVIEQIDLNEFVEEMTHLLEVSISKKTVLRYDLAAGLPTIDGDATQIRQIIMNLITNASEAIGDKSGVIALSTEAVDCDRTYLSAVGATFQASSGEPLSEGLYVCLEVADTGCGMDKATTAKIFDPFYTTKFTGRGLGMSAVLGIVRGHKGVINIYSEVGKGTTFKVLFPASEAPAQEAATRKREEAEAKDWRGEGTILIVDDEETICSVGKQMVELLGFTALTAVDGREGVEVFSERGDEIVCVLLDLTMPHMDGEEAFREMRRIRSDVNIILCSGYSEQEATERFSGKGLASFLQKPYSFTALRAKLTNMFG